MFALSSTILSHLPAFLQFKFQRTAPCYILRLPPDILLDVIFTYLFIEDVICLRRTCKAFFVLTHEPCIWKRFLQRLQFPIPPFRPSFRYALKATDFEVEQLVTRAISLDDNWRRPRPTACCRELTSTCYTIFGLSLLAGGKFLVVSAKDTGVSRYFVFIYALDHPVKGNRPIARLPTSGKASHIRGAYMRMGGKTGIMLTYVKRMYDSPFHQNPFDENEYHYDSQVDSPVPFIYEAHCHFIDLDDLEIMANGDRDDEEVKSRLHSNPFMRCALLERPSFLQEPVTAECFGRACMVVTELSEPNRIHFLDLENGSRASLICHRGPGHERLTHRIRGVRVLPCGTRILVVRSIMSLEMRPEEETVGVEIFEIPTTEDFLGHAVERVFWFGEAESVRISDPVDYTPVGDQPRTPHSFEPPPPISIYLNMRTPLCIAHVCVWPTHNRKPDGSVTYDYSLDFAANQKGVRTSPVTHVLPGVHRCLTYTTSTEDRKAVPYVLSMQRYVSPQRMTKAYRAHLNGKPKSEFTEDEFTDDDVDEHAGGSGDDDAIRVPEAPITRRHRSKLPTRTYSPIKLPSRVEQLLVSKGLCSITWDEGIGRVCFNMGGETKIRIIDFASVITPEDRWKKHTALFSST